MIIFRKNVSHLAQIAKLLMKIARKNKQFEWKMEHFSFHNIKKMLTDQPILKLFNTNADKSKLHTDASSSDQN